MATIAGSVVQDRSTARITRLFGLVGRRVLGLLGSLFLLVTAGFLMIHLVPGDPIRGALGRNVSEQLVQQRRDELGLNDPLIVQYWHYLTNVPRGNFGTSLYTGQSVSETVSAQFAVSLSLALWAFVAVIVFAVPVGVIAAGLTRGGRRRNFELSFTTTTIILATIPGFILAQVLVYVFAVKLGWLPIAGRSGPESYILPVISLAAAPAAILTRIVRIEILSVLDEDFIRTARSKRLPGWWIYAREAMPNAMTATLTVAGLMLTGLIAGTILIENVFSWPGLGTTMVSSIRQKDYPVVQAVLIIYGFGVILTNALVDIILAAIDPRSTLKHGNGDSK